MFCRECGTKSKDTDKFCENCGHPLIEETKPKAVFCKEDGARNEGNDGSNVPMLMFLSVSALVLIGLIVFGAFLLFGKDKNPKNATVAQITEAPTMVPTEAPKVASEDIATPVATVPPTKTPTPSPTEESTVITGDVQQQERPNDPNRKFSGNLPPVSVRNDMIFTDSDIRLLTTAELDRLTDWQIRVARNELFARHGRKFKDPEVKAYFENQAWYRGEVDAETFDNNRATYMTETEIKNMDFINKYEKDKGINQD